MGSIREFSLEKYRKYNIDLKNLSDIELFNHFISAQHEARLFGDTHTTSDYLSMRYLRGNGIEVGAGLNPTSLYGNANAECYDYDEAEIFGGLTDLGNSKELQVSVDCPVFLANFSSQYDFVIASHVLEHADSFIYAFDNLTNLVRDGGYIYIVLPDITYLDDANWLNRFDFEHHKVEYKDRFYFRELHDRCVIDAGFKIDAANEKSNKNEILKISNNERSTKLTSIPDHLRYAYHKHNYTYAEWICIFQKTVEFLENKVSIVDVRFGAERLDCHFIFRKP